MTLEVILQSRSTPDLQRDVITLREQIGREKPFLSPGKPNPFLESKRKVLGITISVLDSRGASIPDA